MGALSNARTLRVLNFSAAVQENLPPVRGWYVSLRRRMAGVRDELQWRWTRSAAMGWRKRSG